MNKFVPVLVVVSGVLLAAPGTTLARGGHGGGGHGRGGSHVVTHKPASTSRSRSANVKNSTPNKSNPSTGTAQASPPRENLTIQPDDIGNDLLNILNTTLNTLTGDPGNGGSFGSSGPGGTTPPEDGPNSLTNGSGGQYQDGTPPNNPPAGAGGTNSGNSNAGSAAGTAMGTTTGSTGSSNPPAPESAAKLAKNAKNLVGKVPAGWGNKRNKVPDPGAPSATPPVNPPASNTPNNPTAPSPVSAPTGPALGGGSDDNSTPTSTSDDTTSAATDAPAAASATSLGIDLVLEDVQQVSPATLVAGPAYQITFRNQGTGAAGKFRVGIASGLDGKFAKGGPQATVDVALLAAGEAKTVVLRLPQKSLKMIDSQNKSTIFTHLFVAVDLTNAISETDKSNNSAIVARTDLEKASK